MTEKLYRYMISYKSDLGFGEIVVDMTGKIDTVAALNNVREGCRGSNVIILNIWPLFGEE